MVLIAEQDKIKEGLDISPMLRLLGLGAVRQVKGDFTVCLLKKGLDVDIQVSGLTVFGLVTKGLYFSNNISGARESHILINDKDIQSFSIVSDSPSGIVVDVVTPVGVYRIVKR